MRVPRQASGRVVLTGIAVTALVLVTLVANAARGARRHRSRGRRAHRDRDPARRRHGHRGQRLDLPRVGARPAHAAVRLEQRRRCRTRVYTRECRPVINQRHHLTGLHGFVATAAEVGGRPDRHDPRLPGPLADRGRPRRCRRPGSRIVDWRTSTSATRRTGRAGLAGRLRLLGLQPLRVRARAGRSGACRTRRTRSATRRPCTRSRATRPAPAT